MPSSFLLPPPNLSDEAWLSPARPSARGRALYDAPSDDEGAGDESFDLGAEVEDRSMLLGAGTDDGDLFFGRRKSHRPIECEGQRDSKRRRRDDPVDRPSTVQPGSTLAPALPVIHLPSPEPEPVVLAPTSAPTVEQVPRSRADELREKYLRRAAEARRASPPFAALETTSTVAQAEIKPREYVRRTAPAARPSLAARTTVVTSSPSHSSPSQSASAIVAPIIPADPPRDLHRPSLAASVNAVASSSRHAISRIHSSKAGPSVIQPRPTLSSSTSTGREPTATTSRPPLPPAPHYHPISRPSADPNRSINDFFERKKLDAYVGPMGMLGASPEHPLGKTVSSKGRRTLDLHAVKDGRVQKHKSPKSFSPPRRLPAAALDFVRQPHPPTPDPATTSTTPQTTPNLMSSSLSNIASWLFNKASTSFASLSVEDVQDATASPATSADPATSQSRTVSAPQSKRSPPPKPDVSRERIVPRSKPRHPSTSIGPPPSPRVPFGPSRHNEARPAPSSDVHPSTKPLQLKFASQRSPSSSRSQATARPPRPSTASSSISFAQRPQLPASCALSSSASSSTSSSAPSSSTARPRSQPGYLPPILSASHQARLAALEAQRKAKLAAELAQQRLSRSTAPEMFAASRERRERRAVWEQEQREKERIKEEARRREEMEKLERERREIAQERKRTVIRANPNPFAREGQRAS